MLHHPNLTKRSCITETLKPKDKVMVESSFSTSLKNKGIVELHICVGKDIFIMIAFIINLLRC